HGGAGPVHLQRRHGARDGADRALTSGLVGSSPLPFMMALAVAGAAAFFTPIATPANTMIFARGLPVHRLLEARPSPRGALRRGRRLPRAGLLAVLTGRHLRRGGPMGLLDRLALGGARAGRVALEVIPPSVCGSATSSHTSGLRLWTSDGATRNSGSPCARCPLAHERPS